MKQIRSIFQTASFIFIISLCVSCGYQFAGGGYIRNTVATVAVPVMENHSTETTADVAFTNAVIREIIEKTDTEIVDEKSADAVLKGSIRSISFATLSRATTETVLERRVTATLDVKLINSEGDVIWSVSDFSTDDDYMVSDDQATDDTNREAAIDEIAERSAERLIGKLLVNF